LTRAEVRVWNYILEEIRRNWGRVKRVEIREVRYPWESHLRVVDLEEKI